MSDKILQEVSAIIADKLGKDAKEIKAESNVINDLGADSLDVVEIIMALEEHYGLSIDQDKAEKAQTVEDIINIIKELQA